MALILKSKFNLTVAMTQYANLSDITGLLTILNDRFGSSISFEQKAGLIQHALRLTEDKRSSCK